MNTVNEQNPMKFEYVYGQNVEKEYPNVRMTIERIYPNQAKQMLEANVGNRAMKRKPIAESILGGFWKLNGASIVFSDDGVLRDGQNRLSECIKSGEPIDTVVVRGVKAESQSTMDSGQKRTVADNLMMLGYKNCKDLQAIGGKMLAVDKYGYEAVISSSYPQIPDAEILKYIIDNIEEMEYWVSQYKRFTYKFKRIRAGHIAPTLKQLRMVDADDMEEFVEQLVGKSIPCQTVSMLHDSLVKNSISRDGGLPQKVLMALVVKAWNAYMRGESVKCLKFTTGGAHPESFPAIQGKFEF